MITVEDDDARMFLNLVEASINECRRVSREEAERLLSTRAMSFTLDAYEGMLDLSRGDMVSILTNLGSAHTFHGDAVKLRFEEGFRSCYSLEVVAKLQGVLEAVSRIDFGVAEQKALRYLPPGTVIESTIYLTVDAFNPAMVRGGNVGLSIISGLDNVNMDHLAHEFHHVGFMNCLSRRPGVMRMIIDSEAPEEIAIQLICHLVSEGMANHYCTPRMVKAGEHKSPRANEKIQAYERNLNMMLEETWGLVRDCMDGGAPLEEYRKRLMGILLDKESVLPKVHFVGEKIIALIEEDPETRPEDIIGLCNCPENVVNLYMGPAQRRGLPYLPCEYVEELLKVVG